MEMTRIFFASSTKPDISGRMELLEFFMSLNNVFVGKGLYFTPVFYAQSDDDASGVKTTESLEREINDCSLAFFLVDPDSGAESGDALQEVFKSARENYGKTGKPVIVITSGRRRSTACRMRMFRLLTRLPEHPAPASSYRIPNIIRIPTVISIP